MDKKLAKNFVSSRIIPAPRPFNGPAAINKKINELIKIIEKFKNLSVLIKKGKKGGAS